MDELNILTDTKWFYDTLTRFYEMNKEMFTMEEMLKQLFQQNNGKVFILSKSDRYIQYDGRVEEYTIGGSVSKEYVNADFYRLIEDLTMAYYKNNGGNEITYTPNLINKLKELKE